MQLELRAATASDRPLIARALFAAWQWRRPWDEGAFQDHLAAASPDAYVDAFGRRPGDGGVIAEEISATSRRFAGAAWYRYFSHDDRRAGFVADEIPELAIAVEPDVRGRGLGRRLLRALMELAAGHGIRALSLHVSSENTAARSLYQSLGIELVRDVQDHGVVMLAELTIPMPEPVADGCVRRVRPGSTAATRSGSAWWDFARPWPSGAWG